MVKLRVSQGEGLRGKQMICNKQYHPEIIANVKVLCIVMFSCISDTYHYHPVH